MAIKSQLFTTGKKKKTSKNHPSWPITDVRWSTRSRFYHNMHSVKSFWNCCAMASFAWHEMNETWPGNLETGDDKLYNVIYIYKLLIVIKCSWNFPSHMVLDSLLLARLLERRQRAVLWLLLWQYLSQTWLLQSWMPSFWTSLVPCTPWFRAYTCLQRPKDLSQ